MRMDDSVSVLSVWCIVYSERREREREKPFANFFGDGL